MDFMNTPSKATAQAQAEPRPALVEGSQGLGLILTQAVGPSKLGPS